jgi:hypothetical protein
MLPSMKLTGCALTAGAICLWISWALMPDAATNNADHILTAVASSRGNVRASALLQLLGAALVVPGLVAEGAPERGTRAGAVVLLWGAMGMAADAVYHQLAFEMTARGVARDAVLPVMANMQLVDLRSLVPLLLAFLVGAIVLGWQRVRRRLGARWAARMLMAPALIIPIGIVAVAALGLPRRIVVLVTLGAICGGLIGVGLEGARADKAPPDRRLTV